MALMLSSLYKALRAANAPEEEALAAAEEVAAYERDLASIRSDLLVLKRGQGVTVAAVIAILVKLFVH